MGLLVVGRAFDVAGKPDSPGHPQRGSSDRYSAAPKLLHWLASSVAS